MPRVRKVELVAKQQASAAAELTRAIDKMPKPKMRSRKSVAEQTLAIVNSKSWSQLQPVHFVELYVLGHVAVYGIEPAELTGGGKAATNARKGAVSAASRMLREFGGDPLQMVRFFDWVWKREQGREEWRKENGREGGRLSWQVMIAGRAILTDYRAAKLRLVPSARASRSSS